MSQSAFQSPIRTLAEDLRRSWSRATSSDPENWSAHNPSLGQCAVTALVIQDAAGGELLRTTIGGVSHYWNRLPSGEEIDLTRGQFGEAADDDHPPEARSREYVLSYDATRERYDLLRRAVLDHRRSAELRVA